MDCLKSFVFKSETTFAVGLGTEYYQWGLAPQNYWAYESINKESTFEIQGFKNINVYSIQAVGNITTVVNNSPVIINDWNFILSIEGNNPLTSGEISGTNNFVISNQAFHPQISLSRYQTKFEFLTPIYSVKRIKLIKLQAQGIGAENLTAMNIKWNMNFIVYYSFEGENE